MSRSKLFAFGFGDHGREKSLYQTKSATKFLTPLIYYLSVRCVEQKNKGWTQQQQRRKTQRSSFDCREISLVCFVSVNLEAAEVSLRRTKQANNFCLQQMIRFVFRR